MTNKPISEVIAEIQRLLSSIEKYQRQGKVGEWVEEYRIATCPAELRRVLDHVAALEQQLKDETYRANQNAEYLELLTDRMLTAEQQLAAERARVVKFPPLPNRGTGSDPYSLGRNDVLDVIEHDVRNGAYAIFTSAERERLAAYDRAAGEPVVVPDYMSSPTELTLNNILNKWEGNSPELAAAQMLAREVLFWRSVPRYSAPPLPVVPDERQRALLFDEWFKAIEAGDDESWKEPKYLSKEWNEYLARMQLARGAWSAAMLQLSGNSEQVNYPVIQEGWALAPVVPTAKMIGAAAGKSMTPIQCWEIMLAAAPQPGKGE